MTDKVFAPDYPRNERGWVVFPRDVEYRKQYFPQEVFDHPAKANLFMVQEMARYLTEPGDSVMDIFGGTGSQLISLLDGRKVVLIELEPYFLDLIKRTVQNWQDHAQDMGTTLPDCYIFEGDCRRVLLDMQFKVDCAIFSPPYSTTMASTGIKDTDADEDSGTGRYKTEEYTRSSLNLSRLNPFLYGQHMDKVMERLSARMVPGGKVCVISKDKMEGPRRVMLSEPAILRAQRHGLKLVEWLKHQPPSTIAKASATIALRKHGKVVEPILDEDLIIFQKE